MWNNTILQKKHQNSLKSRNTIKTFYIDRPPVHLECAVGGGEGSKYKQPSKKRDIYTIYSSNSKKSIYVKKWV